MSSGDLKPLLEYILATLIESWQHCHRGNSLGVREGSREKFALKFVLSIQNNDRLKLCQD